MHTANGVSIDGVNSRTWVGVVKPVKPASDAIPNARAAVVELDGKLVMNVNLHQRIA